MKIGENVPNFSATTHENETISSDALKGQAYLLFFYPRANTSGCTKEAIGFTELLPEFENLGAIIVGMSPDPVKKHDKFRDKHDLAVTLLSDADSDVCERYGVWVEKNMYGKKYMGIERATYLIDAQGKIAQIWRKVRVPGHVDAVLEATQAL